MGVSLGTDVSHTKQVASTETGGQVNRFWVINTAGVDLDNQLLGELS